MIYDYADRLIKDINRRNLRAFGRLKQLKFDELNIVGEVNKTYDDSVRLVKKRYYQIAIEAYINALIRALIKDAEEMAEDSITEDWVLDMLEEYDPVTLYQFIPEVERKKQRTIEAIIASHDKGEVIDRALRLWTLQTTHYAIKSVDKATMDAYKAAGVERVMWNTEKDTKVCAVCRERDGMIYPIDKVPDKAHYNCRCYLTPVL